MAYKTLRNKAFRDSYRLLECDFHGETWYSDTYIALKFDVFNQYHLKKEQELNTTSRPKLDEIIGNRELKLAEFEAPYTDIYTDFETTDNQAERVQTKYLDLVRAIWPNCTPWLETERRNSPVHIYNGTELVAVIMPVRN